MPSCVNCSRSLGTAWALQLQPGAAIILQMQGAPNTGAVHNYLIDALQQSWDKRAFTTLLYRRRDPRLREVKGLAHSYVDLGHGGRAGLRIQASLPVALVLSYSVYSARTQGRMT